MLLEKPDDPDTASKVQAKVSVNTLIVEHCSDVILNLTRLVPDYGNLARYDDLFTNPFRLKNTCSLYRKIKLWVPLFYVKEKLILLKSDLNTVIKYQE